MLTMERFHHFELLYKVMNDTQLYISVNKMGEIGRAHV